MKTKRLWIAIAAMSLYANFLSANEREQSPSSAEIKSLAVTMTNAAQGNSIQVYDPDSQALLQTLSTGGDGGGFPDCRA